MAQAAPDLARALDYRERAPDFEDWQAVHELGERIARQAPAPEET